MHKEKKVTFLISSLAGGGAEGVCVNVANGLAELGWQVDLVEYLNIKDFKANLVQLLSAKFNAEAAQNTVKQNQVDEVVKHYAKQIACFD